MREAGLATIMNAYHELDGIPCGASRELLTDILRTEWGFDGIVTSDYDTLPRLMDYHFAAADKGEAAKIALEAGLDIELSRVDVYGQPLLEAVQSGRIELAVLDESVRRVLAMKFKLGLFDNPTGAVGSVAQAFDQPAHRALARTIARQSLVLLKNDGALLPLAPALGSIAVIGPNAHVARHLVGDYSYASMADVMDGGHKQPGEPTNFPDKTPPMLTILDAIREQAGPDTVVRYAEGCHMRQTSREGFVDAVLGRPGLRRGRRGGRRTLRASCKRTRAASATTAPTWACPACRRSWSRPSSTPAPRWCWCWSMAARPPSRRWQRRCPPSCRPGCPARRAARRWPRPCLAASTPAASCR